MKIKEVCERTGLTERTVRFYVEQQLINPSSRVMNGREYRDYSMKDVHELQTIAALRKAFFSIDEIKRMKDSPEQIEAIVADYKKRQAADAQAKARLVDVLATVDMAQLSNINSLANVLDQVASDLPLPRRDIESNFGRFDGVSEEEREAELRQFRKRQQRQQKIGYMIILVIALGNVVASLVSLFANFNGGSLIGLILQIIFSIALFNGVAWVRYLFAIGAALQTFILIVAFSQGIATLHIAVSILLLLYLGFSAATCILLLRSTAVSEFLYGQRNG